MLYKRQLIKSILYWEFATETKTFDTNTRNKEYDEQQDKRSNGRSERKH